MFRKKRVLEKKRQITLEYQTDPLDNQHITCSLIPCPVIQITTHLSLHLGIYCPILNHQV